MAAYPKNPFRGSAGVFVAAIAVFLVVVGAFIGVFRWYGRAYVRVSHEREYYFLVQTCEDATVSAVAGQVYFSGGAGYELEAEGKRCVAIACYFRRTDAERIQSAMREKGVAAEILSLSGSDFALEGENAGYADRVTGNLETAETCARILFDTANGLERLELSQDEAHTAVRGVVKALKGLRAQNAAPLFSRWNAALVTAESRGKELAEGILFAKDLRYLQTSLCHAIVRADSYFT